MMPDGCQWFFQGMNNPPKKPGREHQFGVTDIFPFTKKGIIE